MLRGRGFKKLLSLTLTAAILLSLLSLTPVLTRKVSAEEPYDSMRLKWKNYLTGANLYSLPVTDPDVTARIGSITSSAQDRWNSMNKAQGRTYLWSDVTPTTYPNSGYIYENYTRLYSMALAYATKGSTLEGNASLLTDLKSALDWMYANQYNENLTWQVNTHNWEINAPLSLCYTTILLYDQLTSIQRTNYMNAVNAFANDPTNYSTGTGVSYGANRLDESKIIALRGVIVKSSSSLDLAQDNLSDYEAKVYPYVPNYMDTYDESTFKASRDMNGWYRDGSFISHNHFAYNGAYGLADFGSFTELMYLFSGTQWSFTDPRAMNVFQRTYNSYVPLMYNGRVMDMVNGRSISRERSSDYVIGRTLMKHMLTLADAASPADAANFKSYLKYWIQSGAYETYYGQAGLTQLIKAKNIVNDPNIIAQRPYAFQVFAGMDRAVQQRPGYAFGISMYSKRTFDYESINNENRKGWYTGYGTTYLYNDDLYQYDDNFWPTVNAKRMPGTTVDAGQARGDEQDTNLSTESWVGGTELGEYGAVGMQLKGYQSTLSAKKSWFLFDDEMVALGADINSTDGRTIETIVDNKKLNAAGDNALTVNGTAKPLNIGWSETMAGTSWIHLQGNSPGSDIGYYFPGTAAVKGLRESRTGSWNDISLNESTTPVTNRFMNLWFDHGTNPSGKTYSYVVLPNKTSAQVGSYASSPNVSILENNAYVQAVKENTLNIVAANFWTDVKRSVDIITSDRKSSVMVRETAADIDIAASDPTWENKGVIELEINKSAAGIISKDPSIVVNQLSPTIKLTVQVNGSMGRTHKIKLSKSELTPAEEITYSPSADAYVRFGAYAGNNYGSASTLLATDTDNADYRRKSYLKFDLSSVNTVTSAKLRINASTQSGAAAVLNVFGSSSDSWTEKGITAGNAPAHDVAAANTIFVNGIAQYYEMDVTPFVQQQVAGDKVITLVLAGDDYEKDAITINSREHSQSQPQLAIVGTFGSGAPEPQPDPGPAPTPTVVLDESFDSYPTDGDPAGWTLDESAGAIAVKMLSGSTSDKDMKLYDNSTTTGTSASKTFAAASGIVTVESRVRAEQTDMIVGAPYIYDSSGNIATLALMRPNGYIAVYDGAAGATVDLMLYKAQEWYKLKFVINTETDTYDFYVDEVKKASGIELRNAVSNISRVHYYFSTTAKGSLYVDDVKVSAVPAPAPVYSVNDYFDSSTVGSAPSGWTVSAEGGSVTVQAIPSTSDKSVRVYDNNTSQGTSAEKAFEGVKGKVTIVYKVRAEQNNVTVGAPYIFDSNGVNIMCVTMGANGMLQTYNGATVVGLQEYTPGTWYTIKLVVDTDRNTFDIYVNGVKKGTDYAFRSPGVDVAKLRYYFGTTNTGTMYYDSVNVYK